MLYLRQNFSVAYIATAVGIPDTSVTVQPGHTLPTTAGSFVVILWNSTLYPNPSADPLAEICIASYTSLDVYALTRAQEGTVAVPHAVNDKVSLTYTAGVSTADLSVVGSKVIDETAIANNYVPFYNSGTGTLQYASVATLNPTGSHGNQLFTSSGTFTAPAGVTQVYLTMVGGGAGGGGSAGNGGSPTNGGTGGTGGSTIFDSTITALGGNGGGGGTTGGSGGAGGAAVVNAGAAGGSGGAGGGISSVGSSAGGAGANTNSQGGGGGGSMVGVGANGSTGSGASSAAANSGAGGGGGGNVNGSSGGGGSGGQGIVNYPYTVIAGNPYVVTIGSGGSAGTAGAGNNAGAVGGIGGSGVLLVVW